MKTYDVEICGTAPLLQNKMSLLEEGVEKKSEKKDADDDVRQRLYLVKGKDGKEIVCQPAAALETALIKVAGSIKLKGSGKKSYKDLFKGSVFIRPDYIPHVIQEWEVHRTTVVIPATKGRVTRSRPMLPAWKLRFTVEILDDRLGIDVLKAALDEAGRTIGIGDWRPRYGRFIVTKFAEM